MGMVLVHAQSDLVLPPLEAAAGGADVPAPPAPWYLEAVQALCTSRARLLFLLLAGVGVSLLVQRRGLSTSTLLRRAGFLAAVGLLLLALGWTDLVLLFYAVLFVLAPALLRLPTPALLGVAVLTAVPALVATTVDPVAGGRPHRPAARRRGGGAAVQRGPGRRAPRPDGRRGGAPAGRLGCAAGRTRPRAARGPGRPRRRRGRRPRGDGRRDDLDHRLCLLAVAACLHLSSTRPGTVVRALALAGGMPLTAYVGHALLFPRVAVRAHLGLGAATGVALAYLVLVALLARVRRRRHRSGPVEAAMRRGSGP